MIMPIVAAFFYFIVFPTAEEAWGVYVAAKVFILLWPVIALVLIEKKRPAWPQRIDWRRHVDAVQWGLLTGLIIVVWGISVFEFTAIGEYVRTYGGAVRSKVAELHLDVPVVYVLFTGAISLLHSLLEEYYWRWFVYGRLRELIRPSMAYWVAGMAFAAYHYVVLSLYFPALGTFAFGTLVGIGGVLWCWMLQRQQSIVGIWISHLLVDVGVFYIGYKLVFA